MTLALPDLIAWLRAKANTQATAADGDRMRQAAEALELAVLAGRIITEPVAQPSASVPEPAPLKSEPPLSLTGYRPPLPPAPPGWTSEMEDPKP